jgi:hypothetical protein
MTDRYKNEKTYTILLNNNIIMKDIRLTYDNQGFIYNILLPQ